MLFRSDQVAMATSDAAGQILQTNPSFQKFLKDHANAIDFRQLISGMQGKRSIPALPVNIPISVPGKIVRLTCISLNADRRFEQIFLWTMSVTVNLSFRNKVANLKNLYRSFMDTSFEIMFRTDSAGKILFVNKLFIKTFGYRSQDILQGLNVQDLLEDSSQFLAIRDRAPEAIHLSDEHLVFRKTNGNAFPAVANIYYHQDASKEKVLNWTVLDISRQKEGEHNLKIKNEELEKVNHQMEKFLYSTSHDLRSPIATILGLVNLMRLEIKSHVMVDYVSKIEISTLKLDKIIKDIMSFSKATYQRLNSERVDFEALAWKAFNNYRDDPASRKIFYEVNVKSNLPFYTDTERLDIILDNVVRNCIHFYDPNKSRPFIKVNIASDKQSAFLEIIDNGIGIGAQHIGSIFKMFFKASHLSKGAGLGLYIVKETIEKLHGTITLESEVGFGTVIRIMIPNDHKGKLIGRKLLLQSNFEELRRSEKKG
jgi:PAS domain S-box-containing protein